MGRFDGHVVLVTGASAGIGAELARQFAQQGADVVVTARRLERLENIAAEIEAMGRRALAVACDVTKDGDMERVVQQTHEALGEIDIVVANAGFGVAGSFDTLTLDDFRRQFETNVFGVLRTAYATLGDLKRKKGRLAVVSSVNGYLSIPGNAPYGMSKYAVRAFCEAVTAELAVHGVSLTMISPGFVASEIRQVDNQGVYKEERKDFVPSWLMMPTDKAARKIIHAIYKRKRERIITAHGWLLVQLSRLTPWLFHMLARVVARKSHEKKQKKAQKPTA